MKTISTNPTAKVAIKKSVLKEYNVEGQRTVFLKDGTTFEIELFNPTDNIIGCKISLNGKEQSDLLVLYPGQRVFLERYLDSTSKFKFIAYEADSSKESKNAIRHNGLLEVNFYSNIPQVWIYNSTGIVSTPTVTWGTTYYTYTTDSTNLTGAAYVTNLCSGLDCISTTADATINTGIISKGENSNQTLGVSSEQFYSVPFISEKIKLLPDSKKAKTTDDIKHKNYCPDCGTKVKHNHKYCSNCGEKL